MIDLSNKIWFGTANGLNSFYINDFKSKDLKISKFLFNDNSRIEILIIFEDKEKNLWLGTYQNGLYQSNGNSFKKVEIKVRDEEVTLEILVS